MEDAGGGAEGGAAGGGVVDEGVTTGADGWSKLANPGLIWTSRDREGARLAIGRPDRAAAVTGATEAMFRDAVGAAMLLREDMDSGLVAIGTIVRSPAGAGVLFDGLSETAGDNVFERFSAEDRFEIGFGKGLGSEGRGALIAAEAGFFISLW